MPEYKVVFHDSVNQDYFEAYAWYENIQEGLGERFLATVRSKLLAIAANPEYFSESSIKGYREAVVDKFPFVVVYRIYAEKQEIFVCSVHHERKHPRHKYRN